LSVSETPGLGVAGGIIHIYRVAVAAKQPMGVRQTTDGGCGETTDGGCGETNDGFVAKRPMGAQYGWVIIDADELPQPLRGNINKLTRYPASPGFRWRSTPGYIPQPLRGNINKLTRYPASPGFRWRSTPGYIPQPLRG